MAAITLRNIPPKLQEIIQRRAETAGLSLSKTIIQMLEEATGQRPAFDQHDHLDRLAGTWSDEEAAAFDAALVEQRKVDPELWG